MDSLKPFDIPHTNASSRWIGPLTVQSQQYRVQISIVCYTFIIIVNSRCCLCRWLPCDLEDKENVSRRTSLLFVLELIAFFLSYYSRITCSLKRNSVMVNRAWWPLLLRFNCVFQVLRNLEWIVISGHELHLKLKSIGGRHCDLPNGIGWEYGIYILSARLTLHSTKLCIKFKIFREKTSFGTKVTSEAFLCISQNL
jgi:hypothetical protein